MITAVQLMAFLIITTDKPGSEAVRAAHRPEHYRFLERHAAKLIASGGLQDDAGEAFIGAAIIIACNERSDAEAFVAEDPFMRAGLFATIRITRWKPAFLDGKRLP